MGLAVAVEIPLVICDIQRGGPSTGLPTKTEQADLLQALFGRNSEAPIPVLAASTPADCFWVAIEASRIAVKYMVPVIILSDGLPRKRRGAVENSGAERNSGFSSEICKRSGRIPSLQTQPAKRLRVHGRFPGHPGSSIASAASKNRTQPATSTMNR